MLHFLQLQFVFFLPAMLFICVLHQVKRLKDKDNLIPVFSLSLFFLLSTSLPSTSLNSSTVPPPHCLARAGPRVY